MTAIEKLIRQKLGDALTEQRKKVAASLFVELAIPPTTPQAGVGAAKLTGGVPTANPPSQGASTQDKKKAQTDKINAQRQKISAMSAQSSTAKDPAAFRDQLQKQNDKLKLMQQKLSMTK